MIFLTISCTMGEDIINDATNEIPTESEQEIILSVELGQNDIETKSTVSNDNDKDATKNEAKINNCVVALLDGNKVIGMKVIDTYSVSENISILAKAKSGQKLIAVVNADNNAFKSCETLEDFDRILLTTDPNGNLVKYGITDLKISSNSSSTTSIPTLNVKIDVKQVAARIDLQEVKVNYVGTGDKPKVTLKNALIFNVKKHSYLWSEGGSTASDFTSVQKNNINSILPVTNGATFYVYQNTSAENKTTMTLTFGVDGANDQSMTFTMKTPKNNNTTPNTNYTETIKQGTLYRLYVTVNVDTQTSKINATLDYEVTDWAQKTVDIPSFK